MHATPNPISTPGFHLHLTYKQADLLVMLYDGPLNTSELTAEMAAVWDDDIADGIRPNYTRPTQTSTYGTMLTLMRRNLVFKDELHDSRGSYTGYRWELTTDGLRATRHYC
jgi:hypothetical protein